MKTLFGILLLLFVAASAALLAVRDPGYVLIERVPFVLETSLAVFALLLAAAFTLFYYGTRLVARILRAPRELARWRQVRRARRAREAFHDGLALLLAGEWLRAEKALIASLHAVDAPYLANLAVAIAAHGNHQPDKRDEYLARAAEQAPEGTVAVDLTRARLQLAAGHPEESLATLGRVRATHPAQPEAARLLIQAYRRLHDWQGLAQLLPEARRRAWLPDAELDAIETETRRELLCLNLPAGALDTLKRAWDETPKHLQNRPAVMAAYARQLLRQQAPDECAAEMNAALDQRWDEELARLYGLCVTARPAAQLEVAEEWLARHGESPALLRDRYGIEHVTLQPETRAGLASIAPLTRQPAARPRRQ
jgi:HemY protein